MKKVPIISSKFLSGWVVDSLGNGGLIYADNDPNQEYFGFGFTAGFDVTYDGTFYKEWGRLYFDSNSNGIYEGIHLYDGSSGIIPSSIGIGGEGIDEYYGNWYSLEYTSGAINSEKAATWTTSTDGWTFEGTIGKGRLDIFSDIVFDTSNQDDLIVGSTNDDNIVGLDGNDVFVGRLGDDKLYGNDGNDTLYGDSGNDILNGGLKDDILIGGTGADTFIVSEGTDQINDFNINEGDKISFANNLSYSISQIGSDLLITVDTLGNFLLKGISNSEFDPNQHILFNDDSIISGEKLALNYIASNPDLISAFGINTQAASSHYTNYGKAEGRSITKFSASGYLAKYSDLSASFGNDEILALKHYIQSGYAEGRTDPWSGSYTLAFDPISTKSEGDYFNLRVTSTGLAAGTLLYFKFTGDID
ncbi:MAG: hypothetical protein JJ843_00005, partial [Prochlorococcus marinus CUG1434]|nr:hypothetical protein [Prochlorococcus marinus CUG1434]